MSNRNRSFRYKWYKNGQKLELPSADQRSTQKPGEGTLIISHPQDEDQGQYQCFAKNEFGTATSNSVLVQKASLNAFKDATPQLIQARENEPFMLSCDAPDAWPRPIIFLREKKFSTFWQVGSVEKRVV